MNETMLMDISNLLDNRGIIIRDRILRAGGEVTPHWHNYFEFEIILSGDAVQIYNGKKYNMTRGAAYLLSYCDFHSFKAKTDVRLLNIRFKEAFVNSELARKITLKPNRLICNLEENEIKSAVNRVKLLSREAAAPGAFSSILTTAVISELLIKLIRKSAPDSSYDSPPLIQQAMAHINSSFREKLTLKMTAQQLSVSVNYLGSLFKKHLGSSFNEYLNNVRLKYACNLLLSSALTVKEIAFASGYSSTEYFTFVFKNKMGTSPHAYRGNKKSEPII